MPWVKLPRIERHEMRFLTARQLEYLTEHHPERARTIVLLGGYMGLRWGEIAGLKRERLNLLQGTLEIRETLVEVGGRLSFGAPKSDAGRRTLRLPDFLVDNLREHLDRFTTHPELVFTGRDGGPYRRGNFRRRYCLPAVEAAVLSPLCFHDLRHTAAGLLIAENVHPKIIQRRLGHSSISVTLDRYGHFTSGLGRTGRRKPRHASSLAQSRGFCCTYAARPELGERPFDWKRAVHWR
jgi:integrase